LFGLDKKQVRVICPFVGGGFCCKGNTWPPATLAAMAAKIVQRTVKLELTRAQMFTSNGYRPRRVQELKFAADATGKLVSMCHDGFSQMSQPALGEFSEPVALATEMLYACPNVEISHRVVPVNAGLPTYMRAPGESSGNFALESAIDEVAAASGMDPLEFRFHNYCERNPQYNKPFASKMLSQCYHAGAQIFGWSRRHPKPRSMRNGHLLVGWGMATSTCPTNQRPVQVLVRIHSDGNVILQSGTQDLGTGTYTVMAQVAAETLGIPIAAVRFELGDSRFPPGPVSGGSSTVPSVAPAVRAACEAARAELFRMARSNAQLGWHNLPAEAPRL
jgi:xanthine dehydrogenase YagR molybdenum-binding subunit